MNLHHYAGLLTSTRRIGPFAEAISEIVEPGSVVLEVGTGLGTFALLAARAGARRVVAVDSDEVVHLARDLARANGLSGAIEFVHGRAPDAVLMGPYDVVVFEDYPTTLLDPPTWRLTSALYATHLRAGGSVLPGAARLVLAPVVGPEWALAPVRATGSSGVAGLDWSLLREALVNRGRRVSLTAEALGGQPRHGPVLPLAPPPGAGELAIEGSWEAPDAPVVGLALWMELELTPGRWISNRPGPAPEPWGQWLVPVDPPLRAEPGELLEARIWREELDDGAPGWMGWRCSAGGRQRRGHEFAGIPLSREALLDTPSARTGAPGPVSSPAADPTDLSRHRGSS